MPALRTSRPTKRPRPAAMPSPEGLEAAALPFAEATPAALVALQQALGALLAAAPDPITKAVHVERAFAIDHQTGWQIYQIVTSDNPLAAIGHVPGRTALHRVLKSAGRRRVPAEVIQRVQDCYDAFDALIHDHATDRSEFESMVRSLLPEEREKQFLAARQAIFKATSQLRGVAMDAMLPSRFLYPSANGTHIDCDALNVQLGLRRLHPAAKIGFGIMPVSGNAFRPETLERKEAQGPRDLLLPEFCSQPLPQLETVEIEGAVHHWVTGNDIGLRSAIDLASAYHAGARWPLVRNETKQFLGVGEVIDVPAARLTFDVFVHQDLFRDTAPELAVYQTIAHGVVQKIGDPLREDDRLHLGDVIQPIPGGLAGAALSYAPAYAAMLAHTCRATGFQPGHFRGYRVATECPFYGAQYSIRFKLPEGR